MDTTQPRPHAASPSPAADAATPSVKKSRRGTVGKEPSPALPKQGALLLCPHPPASCLTRRIAAEAKALHAQGVAVRLVCQERPDQLDPAIPVQEVGSTDGGSLLEQALSFADRVVQVHSKAGALAHDVVAFGSEWTSVPALRQLAKASRVSTVLSLTSLECQRSDMSSELSRAIERMEHDGLESAQRVLVSSQRVAGHAVRLAPECAPKLRHAREPFPMEWFESNLDPGAVKARYQIGPVDPTVLFIGNMDWVHGPDILSKAMPALLRNHGNIRAVFVGDGDLLWPVRVQARYMLIEHAVRILGHREGQELNELIAATDIVVVPSRERTEDWQMLAGWAGSRPVVATHSVAADLGVHEDNAVLVYPNPGSCVWGVERVLHDGDFGRRIGARGRQTVEARFGWTPIATQLLGLMDELAGDGSTHAG